MTIAPRTHFAAVVAAVVCTLMTVGFSIAPAVAPLAPYVA